MIPEKEKNKEEINSKHVDDEGHINFLKEKQAFEVEKKEFQKQKFILDGGKEEKFNEYIQKVEKAKKAGLDEKDLNLSSYFDKKPLKEPQIQSKTEKSIENHIPNSLNKNKDTKIIKGEKSQKTTRVVFDE